MKKFIENETTELRKSLAQLKEGIISLSSMLNKHNHGEVYFGINDDGKVVGLMIGKKTINDIGHEIHNNLKPLPLKVEINELIIDNKSVIKVYVEGIDTPYSAYGRFYTRINDADIVMHANELQHYFESKTNTYFKWEQKETNYTVDDIDEDLLIDCIRQANEKGRLDYVYRNPKEALNKLGLLTDNYKLNNAGLYLFGNNKPLTIKLASYPTDSRLEFGEIKEFRGNIITCLKEAISYIQNHLSYKANIVGLQREEIPEIPLRAIREIVINSFAHCSYATSGDFNQYTIFKSYIKIYNPGPIYKDIDPIKFAKGEVGSKIRNLLIANTLFKYGYIDSFGTGFDRTFTLCKKENVTYKYQNDDFGFTFIFNRKANYLTNKKNKNNNVHINNIDKKLLSLLSNDNYLTIPDLSSLTNKSIPTIQRHLTALVERNIIKRNGSRKNGYWEILD